MTLVCFSFVFAGAFSGIGEPYPDARYFFLQEGLTSIVYGFGFLFAISSAFVVAIIALETWKPCLHLVKPLLLGSVVFALPCLAWAFFHMAAAPQDSSFQLAETPKWMMAPILGFLGSGWWLIGFLGLWIWIVWSGFVAMSGKGGRGRLSVPVNLR
jgi:hypothetical protein